MHYQELMVLLMLISRLANSIEPREPNKNRSAFGHLKGTKKRCQPVLFQSTAQFILDPRVAFGNPGLNSLVPLGHKPATSGWTSFQFSVANHTSGSFVGRC